MTAEQYLETVASPEIRDLYFYLRNRRMTDELNRQRAYDLLTAIDRKLNGTPTQQLTQQQLDFQMNDYRAKIAAIATWMPDQLAAVDILTQLANNLQWRLKPVKPVTNRDELLSPVGQQPTQPLDQITKDKSSIDVKKLIVPGILVGGYLLYKLGAFDWLIKRMNLNKRKVNSVVDEAVGRDDEFPNDEDDDELPD